jgi:hypothetical protein
MTEQLEVCSRCGKPAEIYAKRRKLCKPCYPADLAERKAIEASQDPTMVTEKIKLSPGKMGHEVTREPKFVKTHGHVEAACSCGGFSVTVPCFNKPESIAKAIASARNHLDFHISRSS